MKGPEKEEFEKVAADLGALVYSKNQAYGSAFDNAGKILAILYPEGVQPQQYPDMLAIVRILDKLFRIATNKGAFAEDPWKDIAGYGLLGVLKEQRGRNE